MCGQVWAKSKDWCRLSNVPTVERYLASQLHFIINSAASAHSNVLYGRGANCVYIMYKQERPTDGFVQKERNWCTRTHGFPGWVASSLTTIAHFAKNHTSAHAPSHVLCFTGGKNVRGHTSQCEVHTVMQRGFSRLALAWPTTVFGTIWQLTHFNRVAKCCTLQVRVRTILRRFAISSDRDGRSVLVQSMHNPLGIEADTSISLCQARENSLAIISFPSCYRLQGLFDGLLLDFFSLTLSCINS